MGIVSNENNKKTVICGAGVTARMDLTKIQQEVLNQYILIIKFTSTNSPSRRS